MDVAYYFVILPMMLACAARCLICARKVNKSEEAKQLSRLYVILATLAVSYIILSLLVHLFRPTHSLARFIFGIEEIILGIAFGIFLAMRILGLFKPTKKE
jgi:hypothetical protein